MDLWIARKIVHTLPQRTTVGVAGIARDIFVIVLLAHLLNQLGYSLLGHRSLRAGGCSRSLSSRSHLRRALALLCQSALGLRVDLDIPGTYLPQALLRKSTFEMRARCPHNVSR